MSPLPAEVLRLLTYLAQRERMVWSLERTETSLVSISTIRQRRGRAGEVVVGAVAVEVVVAVGMDQR